MVIYFAFIFMIITCSGCGLLQSGAEREVQREAQKVLNAEFDARLNEALRTEDSGAAKRVRELSTEVLDKEIPSDYRATIRVIGQHGSKGLFGILLLIASKLGIDLNKIKRNGNGTHAKNNGDA